MAQRWKEELKREKHANTPYSSRWILWTFFDFRFLLEKFHVIYFFRLFRSSFSYIDFIRKFENVNSHTEPIISTYRISFNLFLALAIVFLCVCVCLFFFLSTKASKTKWKINNCNVFVVDEMEPTNRPNFNSNVAQTLILPIAILLLFFLLLLILPSNVFVHIPQKRLSW